MPRKTTEPIPTLADLIRDHQDKTGDSYGDIAKKTGLSKAKVGQLARPENTYLVRQETLAKLAHGLSIPLATVQRASLGTAGYADKEVQHSDKVRVISERLGELSGKQLDLAADLIAAVARH